jgi:hypothetical protein
LKTVASFDEGLYLLVAREWLVGHLPYVTAWECKPPLFFALLVLLMKVFGFSTLAALRFGSDATVAIAAIGVYRISRLIPNNSSVTGFAAAITYASLTLSDSGVSGDPELFYAPCIIWPLAFALESICVGRKLSSSTTLLSGVLLGAAFQIKQSAAPEAALAMTFVAVAAGFAWRQAALILAGFTIPIVIGIAPYIWSQQIAFYLDANLWTLLRRGLGPPPPRTPLFGVLREQVEAFFPSCFLLLVMPYFVGHRDARERRLLAIVSIWFLVAIATLIPIREFLGYQFIPAMAPASIIGTWTVFYIAKDKRSARKLLLSSALLAVVAHAAGQFTTAVDTIYHRIVLADPTYGDDTARLADFLRHHRSSGAWLYVARDEEILYLLADAPLPTRFPFPPHLLEAAQQVVSGSPGAREVDRIFGMSPNYVVFDGALHGNDNESAIAEITRNLLQHYSVVYSIGDRRVYVRTTDSPPPHSPHVNPSNALGRDDVTPLATLHPSCAGPTARACESTFGSSGFSKRSRIVFNCPQGMPFDADGENPARKGLLAAKGLPKIGEPMIDYKAHVSEAIEALSHRTRLRAELDRA